LGLFLLTNGGAAGFYVPKRFRKRADTNGSGLAAVAHAHPGFRVKLQAATPKNRYPIHTPKHSTVSSIRPSFVGMEHFRGGGGGWVLIGTLI